jgi:protein-S-isoprenylcysteine O-methyltransferase Ste14
MKTMNKEDFELFLEKVPLLRKWKFAILTILYMISLIAISVVFFFFINKIDWWGPLLSQAIMCVIVCIIGLLHFRYASIYRRRYQDLAYQRFLYVFVLPYLVAWYNLFFHPAFIKGTKILPIWAQVILVVFFVFLFISSSIQIERSGFSMMTHGMDLFTVFPEETGIVRGRIYSFIRHPLHFALLAGGVAMGFVSNTWIAIVAATFQIVPCVVIGLVEDRELIIRSGEDHKEYIKQTAFMFPLRKLPGFLKLLLLGK